MDGALYNHALDTRDMVPHLATLARLAHRAENVIEFGVRTGVSTWVLLDALSPDGRMHSYDIDNVWDMLPSRVKADHRWTFHLADSLTAERPPVPPDVAFLDSSHEYHQTLAELELVGSWETRAIVLHDWNLPDVQDAVLGYCYRSAYRIVGIEPSQWGMVWLSRS